MRHVIVDQWSRGSSVLQRRDPRAKLICLLLLLVAVPQVPLYVAAAVALGIASARLPVLAFLARTAVVLPFAITLAAAASITGEWQRGLLLVARSWVSACAILLLASTTPLPEVLRGLRSFRLPPLLLEAIQFVYRYLFVLAEQVWKMRSAAAARAGQRSYAAAVGSAAALFSRSYARAENVHRAMLARGYTGDLPVTGRLQFQLPDYLLIVVVASYLILGHAAAYLGS